jgi:hypothetical protein
MGDRRRVGRQQAGARHLRRRLVRCGFAHAAAPLPIHPTHVLQALGDWQFMYPTGHTHAVQRTFHQRLR